MLYLAKERRIEEPGTESHRTSRIHSHRLCHPQAMNQLKQKRTYEQAAKDHDAFEFCRHPILPAPRRACTRALTSSISSRLSSHHPDPIEASCAHPARHESANRRHARIAAPAPACIASRASCRTSSKSTVHGNAYMSPLRSPPPRAPPSPRAGSSRARCARRVPRAREPCANRLLRTFATIPCKAPCKACKASCEAPCKAPCKASCKASCKAP